MFMLIIILIIFMLMKNVRASYWFYAIIHFKMRPGNQGPGHPGAPRILK